MGFFGHMQVPYVDDFFLTRVVDSLIGENQRAQNN